MELKIDADVEVGIDDGLDVCYAKNGHNILATAHASVTHGNRKSNTF